MNAHVLGTCHRCGEEEIFQVHGHETRSQMSILDGDVEQEFCFQWGCSWGGGIIGTIQTVTTDCEADTIGL